MKNTSTFFLLFILIFHLSACNSKIKRSEIDIPIISLQNENYLEDAFSLIKSDEIIQLSSKDENEFFSNIYKLMFTGDTLIIYDNFNRKILLFDKEGNFLDVINKQGKGPGEYAFVSDVIYQDDLYILDRMTLQIHRYNLSGQWHSSRNFDSSSTGTSFEKNNSAYIFYRNGMDNLKPGIHHNFASFSTDSLQFIDSASYIVKEIANRGLSTTNPFRRFKDEIYALPPFEDVIYRMDSEGTLDSVYSIDVPKGSRLSEENDWNNTDIKNMDFMKAAESFKSIYFFGNLQISEQFLLFGFRKDQEDHYCIYNKQNGLTKYFRGDKLLQKDGVNLSLMGVHEDYFYFKVFNNSGEPLTEIAGHELREDLSQVLYKVKFEY